MTFPAKVLTVLILVLAIVFATAAGILYTKRIDFAERLENLETQLRVEITNYKDGIARRDRELAQLREDFKVQHVELDRTRRHLEDAEKKGADLEAQLADWRRKEIRWEASNTSLQEMLKAADDRRGQVEKELAERESELRKTREQLDASRAEVQRLSVALAETEEERDQLAMNLKAAQERLEAHDQKFAELRRIYFADERLISIVDRIEPVMADIQGRVMSVDQFGNVIINVGKDDNVMNDYLFTIYRDDKYIAQIRIFKLDEAGDLAAGTVVNLNDKGYEIRQGDSVATRLIP